MSTVRVSMRQKRKEAPEWIFSWRGRQQARWPGLVSLVIVSAIFVFGLILFQIQIRSPSPWVTRQAKLYRSLDDPEGRSLALRAREEGPFPSRLLPSEIKSLVELEKQWIDGAAWQPPAYQARLRELPADAASMPELASPGLLVLPKRPLPQWSELKDASSIRAVPQLMHLAGADAASLQRPLPDYPERAPQAVLDEPWRFLLEVEPEGRVRQVLPFSEAMQDAYVADCIEWLREIRFEPVELPDTRWVAVALLFANPVDDGSTTQ